MCMDRPSTKSHCTVAGKKKKRKEKEKRKKENEITDHHQMVMSAAVSRDLQRRVARRRWR